MNEIKTLLYGNTKCYLINNRVMIDTDLAGTLSSFFRCIKENNVEIKDIEYLLITHFHPDHMGIAQELADLGVKIIAFEEQIGYLHYSDGIFTKDRRVQFKPIIDNNVITLSCMKSREFLRSVGVSGEVLYTPGHSDDSISVVLDEGIAIVGDLCQLYTVPAYNSSILVKSWDTILSHDINLIYYAHEKEDLISKINSINDIIE